MGKKSGTSLFTDVHGGTRSENMHKLRKKKKKKVVTVRKETAQLVFGTVYADRLCVLGGFHHQFRSSPA